ncbi:MAG TPA: glycogen/starch/alpha-glucan phosphorylase, partial [Geminicoccaceae bacterium]
RSILEKLTYAIGKDAWHATERDWFGAVALALRDRIVDRWMATTRRNYETDQKRVYYLSLEFLIGRLMRDALANLEITEACETALSELGVDPAAVLEMEPDAALGNGGLGRLAACFLDSMATGGLAGYGYGIRYDYGLFRQSFEGGEQVELPDDWLRFGNPWEFERPEVSYPIDFYGQVEHTADPDGTRRAVWHPGQRVIAVAYDTPVVGWQGQTVNTLRLWSARPANAFDLEHFNRGDYMRAVEEQMLSRTISRVLYPNDQTPAGQELRLKQEYFFTSASLQDLLRRYHQHHKGFDALPERVAIQLNDTHPAIAVPELMRLLIDVHGLGFERAWQLTRACISYTNHTLMPEALERWPLALMERLLPRHMELIYEINARFLNEIMTCAEVADRPAELSLIDEANGRSVRMGHLAFVGSHRINGVSALHTELMKQTVFSGFHACFPDRIVNQTNGITPRRWLLLCNRPLAQLATARIGDGWVRDLELLEGLAPLAGDPGFRAEFAEAKRCNKRRLAAVIAERAGLEVDPEALFDVHIKRIHEYKRQLLNVLETIALWQAMKADPRGGWQPRLKIFAGKAAPGYERAKQIIRLINDVARVVNDDPETAHLLKVVFLPNYNVSLAERIIPAADLSEQVSTAGMEASGTGNMKLALSGALTIGTLDGANVEIRERVGPENIFIFGLTAGEVVRRRANGWDPADMVADDPRLKAVLDAVAGGQFSSGERRRYASLIDDLLGRDHFMVTADFASYWTAQRLVDQAYAQRDSWLEKAVLNTARVGWFSSDRTIRSYAREIWDALPDAQADQRLAG